jgi:hypothetical protein
MEHMFIIAHVVAHVIIGNATIAHVNVGITLLTPKQKAITAPCSIVAIVLFMYATGKHSAFNEQVSLHHSAKNILQGRESNPGLLRDRQEY